MKTRTLLYTLSASVLMTLTSCNNWLDTGSSTQIRGDELLKPVFWMRLRASI